MIRKVPLLLLSCVVVGLLSTSCSKDMRKFRKYSTKGDIAQKDSAAFFFYERGTYDKAGFLFEELLPIYGGRPRAEEVLYHLAYSKYKQKSYLLAAYHFEQYSKQYPKSARAEECLYMVAYCYYTQSDPFYLDQSSTRKAIDQFQYYLVNFPESERKADADSYLSELRERLAKKTLEQAYLYYNTEQFKGGVTAFEVFIQEYPDSRYREEAEFMIFKCTVSLADRSTERRKKNRYLDALDHYQNFVDRYPDSTYLKDAETIFAKAKKSLEKILEDEDDTNS
ncbi:MAG: outer membrane protein assembly factor BamD [Bacteroidota bacterium]